MDGLPFGCALALAAAAASLSPSSALAHGVVGNRFFPATLSVDDPAVADELSAPTVSAFKNGDNVNQRDVSFEYSKRITDAFAVSVGPTWTRLQPGGSGWQNFETTFKYQLITDGPHEFILSAGLGVEWGGTGAARVGAESFSTVTPTIFFGKGLGDLPIGMLRPLAVTGQVGFAYPTQAKKAIFGVNDDGDPTVDFEFHAQHVKWGVTLQYSMPYLKANVVDLGLPEFFNRLIPIIEASFSTPTTNNVNNEKTTGTINPGVIWAGQTMQFGIEALIPINRQSGQHIGVIGQVHFYLDDIFPTTIGKPIFASR
jgi:hypothetical protein